MADEQQDKGAVTQSTGYCTTQPAPGTFLTLPTLVNPCPDCDHAALLHIGADHCPVCELVDLNRQAREGHQVEVHVEGQLLTDGALVAAIKRGMYKR